MKKSEMIYMFYPLTVQQQNVWNDIKAHPHTGISNIGGLLCFNTEYDFNILNQMVHMLIKNNVVFSLRFIEKEDTTYQFCSNDIPTAINESDLRGKTQEEIDAFITKKMQEPFESTFEQMYRFYAINLANGQCGILICVHRLICDTCSVTLICNELIKNYRVLTMNEHSSECGSSFIEAVNLEKRYLSSQQYFSDKEYWNKAFSKSLRLCRIKAMPNMRDFKTQRYTCVMDDMLCNLINTYYSRHSVLPNVLFEAALVVYLHRINECASPVVFGTVAQNRTDTEKNAIGMYEAILPLSVDIDESDLMLNLSKRISDNRFEISGHEKYPMKKILGTVQSREQEVAKLYDVIVTYDSSQLNSFGQDVSINTYSNGTSEVSLCLRIEDINKTGRYRLHFDYRTSVLTKTETSMLCDRLLHIIRQSENKDILIKDIEVICESEKEQILVEFNDTAREYPKGKTVVQLFEERTLRTLDKTAIVYKGENLTYQELNEKANILAHKLRSMGLKRDEFVAIIAERSIEMIAGIYGIIKAGGAYVPIDSTYPEDRIQYILEDCKPKAILTCRTEINTEIPVIDLGKAETWEGDTENPANVNKPNDLIYCIYTSGTTGRPKGVMIEHHGVVNYIQWMKGYLGSGNIDMPLFTSVSFDLTVTTIFAPILTGSRIIIYDENRDVMRILKSISEDGEANTIKLTPSHLMLIDETTLHNSRLENFILGGENLTYSALKIFNGERKYKIYNEYGPTEATVACSVYMAADNEYNMTSVPIGKPAFNSKVYILHGMNLCGLGISGELCIAGDGLARGYLNQPELTAEKFIDNPYGEGKLYRTGDLARWQPDGNIEYLGRIDEQVKIRGFRIELGEIESAIRNIEFIKDCAVIAKDDASGDKSLYAYIVPEVSEEEISVSAIRDTLAKALPEYMIPVYITQIETIPVTQNGKLDKRALPEIEAKTENEYIAPRNETERILSGVFEEILGIEKISIYDNFLWLGGDSIKAIRVVSKMREAGYDLNVKDVMSLRTIATIGEITTTAEELSYEQGEVIGEVMVTPIIEAFESWQLEEPHHFNQAMMIKVDGTTEEVEKIIKVLVSHHDMLRCVYAEGRLIIQRNEEKRYEYEVYDLREEDNASEMVEQICDEKQRSMNLEKGPLFKCVLFQLMEGNYLFMCLHHLVVDGVSWRILIEDVQSGLKQQKEGEEIKLPKKTASFKEWSEALKEYKDSKKLEKEIEYWRKVENEMKEGRYKGEDLDEEPGYEAITLELTEKETSKLLYESGKAYNTAINDLLLSALGMAIKEVRNQEKVTVMLEGHGREELNKNIKVDRTVGWFTSIYPVIVECCDEVEDSIIRTKEILRKVPNNGIGYGVLSVKNQVGDICFNYLGELEGINDTEIVFKVGKSVSEKNRLPEGIEIMELYGARS